MRTPGLSAYLKTAGNARRNVLRRASAGSWTVQARGPRAFSRPRSPVRHRRMTARRRAIRSRTRIDARGQPSVLGNLRGKFLSVAACPVRSSRTRRTNRTVQLSVPKAEGAASPGSRGLRHAVRQAGVEARASAFRGRDRLVGRGGGAGRSSGRSFSQPPWRRSRDDGLAYQLRCASLIIPRRSPDEECRQAERA